MLLPVNGSLATPHHAILEFLKKLGLCSYEIVRKNSQFLKWNYRSSKSREQQLILRLCWTIKQTNECKFTWCPLPYESTIANIKMKSYAWTTQLKDCIINRSDLRFYGTCSHNRTRVCFYIAAVANDLSLGKSLIPVGWMNSFRSLSWQNFRQLYWIRLSRLLKRLRS